METSNYFRMELIFFVFFNLKPPSCEMEGLSMFREGVGLLMESLWAFRIFKHELFIPELTCQLIAGDIVFWFTQSISKKIK